MDNDSTFVSTTQPGNTASIMAGNRICANEFSNYVIGSNICNGFAIGAIGASDDFFLVGVPATEEGAYPTLTGNFLDAEGNPLFRLVRNVLVANPRNCSKIIGNHIGFEIHDAEGKAVFKVESTWKDEGKGSYITTISGTFCGKDGSVIVRADEGAFTCTDGAKVAMGWTGNGFAMLLGMSNAEAEVANWCLASGGAINQILRGEIASQDLNLDGKLLIDATVRECSSSTRRQANSQSLATPDSSKATCRLAVLAGRTSLRWTTRGCSPTLRPRILERSALKLECMCVEVASTRLRCSFLRAKHFRPVPPAVLRSNGNW